MADYGGSIVDLLDQDGDLAVVQEGESCKLTGGTLKDGDDAIVKAVVGTLTLTLYDERTGTIINSRSAQDIKDTNGGALAADGGVTLRLHADDNALVGDPGPLRVETHIARIGWTWTADGATQTGYQEYRYRVQKLRSAS